MTETQILFDLLEKGISPAHAVSACEKRLTDAGFEVVDYGTAWNSSVNRELLSTSACR